MFIGIEDDINTIRHVIAIDSHSFKEVTISNLYSNLSIVIFTKTDVINTATNLDCSIGKRPAFFTIANHNSLRVNRNRRLTNLECHFVYGCSYSRATDVVLVARNITKLSTRRRKNFNGRLVIRPHLLDFDLVNTVSFGLQFCKGRLELSSGHVHVILCASANVQIWIAFEFFFKNIGGHNDFVILNFLRAR